MLFQLRLREGDNDVYFPLDFSQNIEVSIIGCSARVDNTGYGNVEYLEIDIFGGQNHQGASLKSNLATDGLLFLPVGLGDFDRPNGGGFATFPPYIHRHWDGINWPIDTSSVSSRQLRVKVTGKQFSGAAMAASVDAYVHILMQIKKVEETGGRGSATVRNVSRLGNDRRLKRPALDASSDVRAGQSFGRGLRRRTDSVGSYM